jgi:rare lipoprotein A (peptidoglycan hydrolase)
MRLRGTSEYRLSTPALRDDVPARNSPRNCTHLKKVFSESRDSNRGWLQGSIIMKVKVLRTLASCITALMVGTAVFSVRATSRQERTTNSRVQKGRAAYYSRALEGHKTACGGRYVASELTTAHRSLPCGTRVRITNTKNGKSVEATVNDWGPASRKRIVDVSRAVAEKLDFLKQGTTIVKVEVVQ